MIASSEELWVQQRLYETEETGHSLPREPGGQTHT